MSQYLGKDGASRIAENFLLKQAEQDAILQNLQFDLKEAEHALVKTIQGPAPLNIRALSRPLDDYLISGSTVQDGTPTPEAPVDVVGCGVRTGNLFDKDATDTNNGYVVNKFLTSSGDTSSSTLYNISEYIELSPSTVYTVFIGSTPKNPSICFYDTNKNYIEGIAYNSMDTITVTTPANAKYCRVSYVKELSDVFMLNLGSEPLTYEPYGYKLPISCGGITKNVYLGEQSATRQIKKLVLTGEEDVFYGDTYTRFRVGIADFETFGVRVTPFYMSHYIVVSDGRALPDVPDNAAYSGSLSDNHYIFIKTTDYASADDFKSYLAAQYAAGTPVTIWYVLKTPETAVVNEPLHKIGNYADTISMTQANITLTTTKGFNTITADTTVLPSNIEVKGVINNA